MNFIKEQIRKFFVLVRISIYLTIVGLILYGILTFVFKIQMPSFSWWSANLFKDNYSESIITEVEASGHNIRNVQYIDAFGRVCTGTYANTGTGLDCDYPPQDRREWTIEDYRKKLK